MDTKHEDRKAADIPRGCVSIREWRLRGSKDIPKFSRIARAYLLCRQPELKEINPDIFGSIQAIVDDEERGVIGMHYTRVPNISKS